LRSALTPPVPKVVLSQPPQPFPVNFTDDPSPIDTPNAVALQTPHWSPLSPLANVSDVPCLPLMCPFYDQELPGTEFSEALMKILDKINIYGGTKKDPTLPQ